MRFKNAIGEKVFYFDGKTIRAKDAYGDKLYYLDCSTLRRSNQYGSKEYYFEGIPEKWVIVCLIK